MQAVREKFSGIDRALTGVNSSFTAFGDHLTAVKRQKVREFISWSVCFAIVCGLMGLLLFLKIGITMGSVTSTLFYLSLGGLIYFITRIVLITNSKTALGTHPQLPVVHELN